MKRTQNDVRTEPGQAEISRRRPQQRRQDRRHHQQTSAIAKFQEWDRAMQRQHGPLYYREMGYTVH